MEGSLFCVRAVVSEKFHSGYFTLSFCRSRERNVQKVLVTLAVTIFLLQPGIIIWSNRRSASRYKLWILFLSTRTIMIWYWHHFFSFWVVSKRYLLSFIQGGINRIRDGFKSAFKLQLVSKFFICVETWLNGRPTKKEENCFLFCCLVLFW